MYPIPPVPPQDEGLHFESSPALSVVQVERLCDGCGYNLQGQQVRREPRTQLLMARCPECGAYLAANPGKRPDKRWRKPDKETDAAAVSLLILPFTLLPMIGMHMAAIDMLTDGSISRPIDRIMINVLTILFVIALVGALLGLLQTALLPTTSLRQRLVRTVAWYMPVWIMPAVMLYRDMFGYQNPYAYYPRLMGAFFLGLAALIYVLMATVACRYGRAWARVIVRIVFAPPWRDTFAALWLCDGLPSPVQSRNIPAAAHPRPSAPGNLS